MMGTSREMVVAIDGPAGAGKSTVARRLADELGYMHLNSGALYRGVTVMAITNGVAFHDGERLARLARDATMEFAPDGALQLNGEDASEAIRAVEVDEAVSKVSVHKPVRGAVTAHQRRIAARQNVVVEGRDVTTVVFPNAPVKFYLDASVEERARRRHTEIREEGGDVTLEEVSTTLRSRDERDATREESPLLVSPDAHVVDTTELSIEQVVARMATIARAYVAAADGSDAETCESPADS